MINQINMLFSLISFFVHICIGKLLPCTEIMQRVCLKPHVCCYESNISPEPLPTKVKLAIKIYEVLAVDEMLETLTLSMRANVEWQDFNLDVNRSKDYIDR